MAIKQVLVDDFDGSEAAETRDFSYNGTSYEIDLSEANLKKFDKDMEKWINAARRRGRPAPRRTRVTAPQAKSDLDAIRAWARGKGKSVSDRGRIPKDIVDQFNTEHEGQKIFSAGAS